MPTEAYSVQDSASPPPKSRQASTNWCVAASISGFLAVGLGAFGAHVLSGRIAETLLSGFRTAVLYHLVHSVALLALALFGRQRALAIHWPIRNPRLSDKDRNNPLLRELDAELPVYEAPA